MTLMADPADLPPQITKPRSSIWVGDVKNVEEINIPIVTHKDYTVSYFTIPGTVTLCRMILRVPGIPGTQECYCLIFCALHGPPIEMRQPYTIWGHYVTPAPHRNGI